MTFVWPKHALSGRPHTPDMQAHLNGTQPSTACSAGYNTGVLTGYFPRRKLELGSDPSNQEEWEEGVSRELLPLILHKPCVMIGSLNAFRGKHTV